LAGRKGLLGISEEAKISDTLDLALRLHPGTRQIFVISDRTTTGLKIREKVQQMQSRFGNRVTFHMLPDISLEDIGRRLRQLPEDSVVLLGVFSRDSSDNFYEYDEVVPKLVENCPAPIYGLWDFFLGQGIIGGKLTCGYLQGQHLAGLGLKILHGVPAAARANSVSICASWIVSASVRKIFRPEAPWSIGSTRWRVACASFFWKA
jgi:sigma-B regulation protein RsbU (phosphoserine phosphatase)